MLGGALAGQTSPSVNAGPVHSNPVPVRAIRGRKAPIGPSISTALPKRRVPPNDGIHDVGQVADQLGGLHPVGVLQPGLGGLWARPEPQVERLWRLVAKHLKVVRALGQWRQDVPNLDRGFGNVCEGKLIAGRLVPREHDEEDDREHRCGDGLVHRPRLSQRSTEPIAAHRTVHPIPAARNLPGSVVSCPSC